MIEAITFDCYGTLIDWRAGIGAYITPILERVTPAGRARPRVPADQWIGEFIERQRRLLAPWRSYREILPRALEVTMQHFGLESFADDGAGLVRSVADWPPFADALPSLRALGRRHRLAIITNMDADLLAATLGQLQAPVSSLVTADEVRAHKPDAAPFRLALERLSAQPHEVLHVSSSFATDLATARAVGMKTAFVARPGVAGGGAADLDLPSLTALPAAIPPEG
jgi:2-haloalkanoic acid dehalogenase type II